MDRGRKRALSPSAIVLAIKPKLNAADKLAIEEASVARIPTRNRSQTQRDDLYKFNATSSPLLRLPAELRNMIFDWVFRGVEYGLVDRYRPKDSVVLMQVDNEESSHTLHDLNLLLVCRQVHAEAALLPYSLGYFDFWGYLLYYEEELHALDRFMKKRTQEQIDAISCVRLGGDDETVEYPDLVEENGAFWVAELAEASTRATLSLFTTSIDSSV